MVRRLREQLAMAVQESGPGATLLVSVREQIRLSSFRMLLHVIFGKELEEEQVRAIDESSQRMFRAGAGMGNVGDFIPLLAPLVHRRHNRRMLAARSKLEEIALPLITQIRDSRLAGTPIAPGSYIDYLVELEERGEVEFGDYIVLCAELLNAGTDTSSSAIEFAMAELVKAPEVQAKLAAQIAAACGGDQQPLDPSRFEDVPYLRAVVLETLRLHSPATSTLPHLALQDDEVGGYAVPRNSHLVAFIQHLSVDPEVWPNPHEFRPERFLDGPPTDITGSKGAITMIPFGAGRRICPAWASRSAICSTSLADLCKNSYGFAAMTPRPTCRPHPPPGFDCHLESSAARQDHIETIDCRNRQSPPQAAVKYFSSQHIMYIENVRHRYGRLLLGELT